MNWEHVHEFKDSKDCTIPMGATSDEVAKRYNVTRQVRLILPLSLSWGFGWAGM